MLGVEDMRSRLHKQADEIERLQQLNEYLRSEKERLSKDVYNLILKKEEVKTENEKLRELVKAAYYEAYRDRDSLGDAGTDDPEDRCAWRLSAAAAAIRESEK
jgi:FtsZ-binding cell division protein ZapB